MNFLQLKGLDQEKEVLITENRNLAEENVNKEPEIIELKSRISELSEEGKTLCTSIQDKLAELSKKNILNSSRIHFFIHFFFLSKKHCSN